VGVGVGVSVGVGVGVGVGVAVAVGVGTGCGAVVTDGGGGFGIDDVVVTGDGGDLRTVPAVVVRGTAWADGPDSRVMAGAARLLEVSLGDGADVVCGSVAPGTDVVAATPGAGPTNCPG
jgi:hypothetical protein